MAIAWTTDLSVGVNRIDEQHKIWFDKANQLFEAGKSGQSKTYISQMLKFLDDYTKQHFADEERYMTSIQYPEIQAQKAAHAAFIQELDKLKKDFDASGGKITVIINANQMVIKWLTTHISQMDKKIGQYAKTL